MEIRKLVSETRVLCTAGAVDDVGVLRSALFGAPSSLVASGAICTRRAALPPPRFLSSRFFAASSTFARVNGVLSASGRILLFVVNLFAMRPVCVALVESGHD